MTLALPLRREGIGRRLGRNEKEKEGKDMAGRVKERVTFRVIGSNEILGEADITQARARAIVKAYALAGLLVEAC